MRLECTSERIGRKRMMEVCINLHLLCGKG